MKLPNKFGTVYKKSGNRRNPYVVVVTVGWDDNGKQIRKILGYVKDKSSGIQLLSEYNKSPYDLELKDLTFSDVWNDVHKVLEKAVENNKMTQSNIKGLDGAYHNHCKNLYDEKLMDLKTKKMQQVIDNSKLGYTGKGYIKTVCKKIFDYAIIEYELPIAMNPADKLSRGEFCKSTMHTPYTDNEIDILWSEKDNSDLVKILLIYIYTGLRPNELFNIKRDDIHLDEDYMMGGSKTESGRNRIIPIHSKIKKIVTYFYNSDKENPFIWLDGIFNYNRFAREYKKVMAHLQMNHIPHDGRHTFISKMKEVGANEFILKKIVGHSISDITENIYTHRKIQELKNEIERIK